MNYKQLVSSAPESSILNAQKFRYTSSAETDLRKTFARLRGSAANEATDKSAGNARPQ